MCAMYTAQKLWLHNRFSHTTTTNLVHAYAHRGTLTQKLRNNTGIVVTVNRFPKPIQAAVTLK